MRFYVFLFASMFSCVFERKPPRILMMEGMAKVTVTLYMDENDKEALQRLADAEERSLSQMAVLILKRAIKQAEQDGKIPPTSKG
jgi:hypothetical protein